MPIVKSVLGRMRLAELFQEWDKAMILRLLVLGTAFVAIGVGDPVAITVTGTGSGMLGATSFTSSIFTFVLTTDTHLLKMEPNPLIRGIIETPSGTPTTFSIAGVGSGTLTDNQQIFVDPNLETQIGGGGIGLRHFEDVLLVVLGSLQLVGYDFSRNIGPLTGTPAVISSGTSFQSTAGALSFSFISTVSFTIVLNPPLPPVVPSISGFSLPAGTAGAHPSPGGPILISGMNLGTGPSDVASIVIGGKAAPVLNFVSPASLLVQVPVDVPTGTQSITATYKNQPSAAFTVTVDMFAPGIYDSTAAGCSDSSGNRITPAHPAVAGTSVTCAAIGLGPTNPPMMTGVKATVQAPTTTPVQVMIGGKLTQPDYAGLLIGSTTDYAVTFKVPPDVPVGSQPLYVTIAGKQSNTVMLSVTAPLPTITSIVNGATFLNGPVAPNSFISIFGTKFGVQDTAANIFPSQDFNGVSVLFNGVAAPLYYVFGSLGQINLVVPSELAEAGTVQVQVKTPQGTSATFPLSLSAASVGMFRVADPSNSKRMNGAVLFANTAWLVMPSSMAAALQLPVCNPQTPAVACGQPAKSGDVIQIYLTGLGRATPGGDPKGTPLASGTVAPANGNPLYITVQQPIVTIGGVRAIVSFSGIAPGNAGLYQVNVTVPDGLQPGTDVPIVVTMPNGSNDTVTIAVTGS